MSVKAVVPGSDWQLLQGLDMPTGSVCGNITRAKPHVYDDIWHAWNARAGYCDYHHLGGLMAPVARVVANRRAREAQVKTARMAAVMA